MTSLLTLFSFSDDVMELGPKKGCVCVCGGGGGESFGLNKNLLGGKKERKKKIQ